MVAVGFEPTKVSQYLLRVPRLTASVRYRNSSMFPMENKGIDFQISHESIYITHLCLHH